MEEAAREIVIQMAAQPLAGAGYSDRVDVCRTKAMTAATLLEAVCRAPGVRIATIATTDKCYEDRQWAWGDREMDRLGGRKRTIGIGVRPGPGEAESDFVMKTLHDQCLRSSKVAAQ